MPPAYPAAATGDSPLKDFALLAARLAIAGSVTFRHGIDEARAGWSHVWSQMQNPWPLKDLIAATGLPYPWQLTAAFTVIALLCSLGLVTGLLTRVSALGLGVLAALLMVFGQNDVIRELGLVYATVCALLVLLGSGRLALDTFFSSRKNRAASWR